MIALGNGLEREKIICILVKPTTNHMLITQKEYNFLCHICGKTFGSMDMLKRHLNCHTDETYKCPMCKYMSPRMDAIRRHSSRQKTGKEPSGPTMALETKPYQANPSSVDCYLYQQTMPTKGFPMDTTWTW